MDPKGLVRVFLVFAIPDFNKTPMQQPGLMIHQVIFVCLFL